MEDQAEELEEIKEQRFQDGRRSVLVDQLGFILKELRYCANTEDKELCTAAELAYERERSISMLRTVCEDFGDNDWEPTLHMVDIIDKHLANYLHQAFIIDSLPTVDEAGVIAVGLSEKLTAPEQAFFIAGFSECIKYLTQKESSKFS